MTSHEYGNRVTANVQHANDGIDLIAKALSFVQDQHGFYPQNDTTLFKGVYYDSKKVGSYIIRARDAQSNTAVVKIQLKPLPFDEGSIIRNVEKQNTSKNIRPVRILYEQPWNENLGFGYLIFEDITHLPNLWAQAPTTATDRILHKKFLDTFFASTLPIEHPWVPLPTSSAQEMARNAFDHFQEIANASAHKHITNNELEPIIETYQKIMAKNTTPMNIHFTHGHLSGLDVKYDAQRNQFILMANLYWSWRPDAYEIAFPLWVDLMHIRDKHLTLETFLSRVHAWVEMFDEKVLGKGFWYILLHQATTTIMLDLGASEWTENEREEKQALLTVWKEFFSWLVENKIKE